MLRNKKAAELPINTLVMVAIAVFVIFLILGFMTGGWGYFAGMFGGTTKSNTGADVARQNCKNMCTQYANDGSPEIDLSNTGDYWYGKLLAVKNDIDLNGDNKIETTDAYSCRGDLKATHTEKVILTPGECPVTKGNCGGAYGVACSDYTTQTACTGEEGCVWKTCSDFTTQAACGGQTGCSWETTSSSCTGTWTACEGTPTFSCTTPATKTACSAKTGCTWTTQRI